MYQLKCGNVTSSKIGNYLNTREDLKQNICKTSSFELISTMIFYDFDPKSNWSKLVSALVLGDQWKVSISKRFADILFFSLCCNCDPKSNVKITNLTQAITLFDESNNDYTAIEMVEEDSKMRFETCTYVKFPCLFPGTKVTFKIPVRFFRNKKTNRTNRALGVQPFFKVSINDNEEVQVPRHLLTAFFPNDLNKKGAVSICVEQEEKISSKFELIAEGLWNVLVYLGYTNNKSINQQFNIPPATVFLDDGHLVCIENEHCKGLLDNSLWEDAQNGRKVFLPRADYILFANGNTDKYVVLIK